MTPQEASPSPLPFGGSLFQTLEADAAPAASFGAGVSPFSSAADSPAVCLTVGDVLPQIPPELARATSVPQDQPVNIAPHILNQALSSGHLAVPLFEVYRVCPGIFQMPVAPDDTRTVGLPVSKLPALVASASAAPAQSPVSSAASPFESLFAAPAQSAPPSPFQSFEQIQPQGSPFESAAPQQAAAPAFGGTSLPPRRDASQPPASSLPPSPFLDFQIEQEPPASPFATQPAAQPASPFPAAGESVSPFAATAPAMENPFTAAAAPQPAPPLPPSPVSPGSDSFAAAPAPAPAMANPAGKLSGPATASMAALLQGQSAEALGFDPAMVPSWITTQFHGGLVAELQEMPSPSMELGTLIDGITDIGFRNVLQSARRDQVIPIPLHLLTPAATPGMASAAPQSVPASQPAPVQSMSVVPPASFTVPAATQPASFAPEPTQPAPEPLPAFAFTAAAAPAEPPAAPVFTVEPGNPFANVPEAPPPAAQPEPAPPEPSVPSAIFPAPAPQTPIQPKVDISDLLSGGRPPSANPAPASVFTQPAAAMDPFAPSEPPQPGAAGGYSSFELFGGQQPAGAEPPISAPPPPAPQPAPAQFFPPPQPPAPNPEAGVMAQGQSFDIPNPQAVFPEVPEATTTAQPDSIPNYFPAPPAERTPAKPPVKKAAPVALFSEIPEPAPAPAPDVFRAAAPEPSAPDHTMPVATHAARGSAPAKPTLGLSTLESSDEEQLLLRALLDTDEVMSVERVVELVSQLPGISACALVRGRELVAGSSIKSQEAKAFRSQAADVAQNLRALAPLIGIADAETFTLNTENRLITLCFPGEITLCILHDRDPALGLRDKLTLIARQLDRMIAKG